MKIFFLLMGILLAILGVASANPIATATTPDDATPVVLGPRRNGFSDLPSDVRMYNQRESANAVPEYVTASDPDLGQDAIIYNRAEIYNALREGYEVVQRTRDRRPGGWVRYGNVAYPTRIDLDWFDLPNTWYGRYGNSVSVTFFIWPILWTDGYRGHNQHPGEDRVVFNENGIFLGVITARPSGRSHDGGYRWCPPTDLRGRWVARWIGGRRGWDWTGVPPDGPNGYTAPQFWNIAESQRHYWYTMNNQGPYGNYIQSNSSTTSSVDMTPPGAPFDDDNPLEVPPADNSTGVWRIYEPSNTTTNLTDEFVAADCVFARDHGAGSYSHSCQTYWVRGQSSMLVRVTISGSGQPTHGWCKGVIDNMHNKCGGNFNLVDNKYGCDEKYPGTATFSKATDPSDPEHGKYYFGIDMHFWLRWPWAESDADHACMSDAVEAGSCAQANVKSINGKWCRNLNWDPQPPPHAFERSNELGPA